MTSQLRSRYDVVINGGGVVGFTLLNLILKSPHLQRAKVLLIEQAPMPRIASQSDRVVDLEHGNYQKQFSNRVSSINKTSIDCLKKMNVWQELDHFKKDIREIKVWNYDYSNKIKFQQDLQFSQEPVFSVVENNRLYKSLVKKVYESETGTNSVIWNHSLVQLSKSEKDALIDIVVSNTESGDQLNFSSSLVIGCDGFKSKVRELANIIYRERSVRQRAVVGTIKVYNTSKSNDIAYQRFSTEKDAVVAILPLDEDHSSFVISAPDEYSQRLLECDEETFIHQFNELLSKREYPTQLGLRYLHELFDYGGQNLITLCQLLPAYIKCCSGVSEQSYEQPPVVSSLVSNSRASFPLASGTTSPIMIASLPGKTHSQIALLGDSCHRVHPLAGQGLNLGLQDAVELVNNLEGSIRLGERVFSDCDHFPLDKALRRFQLNRQLHIVPIHAAISMLPTLFKLSPTSLISAVNKCNPIKRISMKFANGL